METTKMRESGHMSINRTESKRVKAFRLAIAKDIPKFPNNKATLKLLENEALGSLLIHYTNWAIRYVSIHPRVVLIEPTATSDERWSVLKTKINSFLEKVRDGVDLTPYLSLEPHTRGYTPASSFRGPTVDRWADKDFLLNVMGYHHFHLGLTTEPKGFITRTDDLLFAKVSREHFTVIALFDHSVFDVDRSPAGTMTKERTRLWKLFDEHSVRGIPPGSVYVPASITTSGHSLHLVRLADEYAYVVREVDPKLDDIACVQEMYQGAGVPCPKKPKLSWRLNVLDLGLFDSNLNMFFVFRYGPN
jgi:hypothetical protein